MSYVGHPSYISTAIGVVSLRETFFASICMGLTVSGMSDVKLYNCGNLHHISRRYHKTEKTLGFISALEEAATILERSERTKNNVVFLTDALSVLQSIKSNKDKEQHSLFTKLTDLSKRYNTTLQWIPAHCGLRGNELADTLAKQGAHLEQIDSKTYSKKRQSSNHDLNENGN